jgi:outer membrane protein insertion porin family
MKQFFGLVRGQLWAIGLAMAIGFGTGLPLRAQAPEQQGPPVIKSIEIQYVGPQTLSRDKILSQMRTKPGQPYSESLVEQDIKALYRTGQVQNVRIFGQAAGEGVKVMVVLQTRSLVNEIEIEGASRINAKTLRRKINLKINGPLTEGELQEAREKIVEAYQAKGYTDIDVKYRVETNEEHGTSRVIYTITEGTKGAISAIRFEGNTKFPDKILRKQMKTKGKTLYSFLDKSGRLDETQLEQDVNAVKEYYQDHGYIDMEVKEVRRERAKDKLTIVVVISEGPIYHVGKISITGTKATSAEKVRKLMKLKDGSVYSPKQIREDSKTIADGYGSGGYVDLQVTPTGIPAGAGRIDIHYEIQEGAPSFVQRINIVGNTRTKDKVIRREVLIAPGDILNSVRVETTKKRLDNLGYFEKVETYPEDTGVPGRKDLTIQVQEKRTGSLNFGAGFSTIDELVGFVEMSQGNFDILNWPTFTGAGQKFRFRIQYGNTRKDITLSLTEPYFLDRRLSLGGEVFFREADYYSDIYTQRNYGFSIEARKQVLPFTSASLGYRLENTEIFDVAAGASSAILLEQGQSTKSQITGQLVNDMRDNPFLTRMGHRIALVPYVAGGFLGGSEQVVGFSLEARKYFHLYKDSILLFSAQFASVDTWGDGTRVRIYDRLFLGGSNDLRGFDYRDVSPRDINGEPLGGQSLASLTVEYTMPIIEKARFAVFFDSGFVNRAAWDFDTKDYVTDVGVGLRLDLPIGPIRIDYGIPLEKGPYKDAGSGKFNFQVGYQF